MGEWLAKAAILCLVLIPTGAYLTAKLGAYGWARGLFLAKRDSNDNNQQP